MTAVTQVAQAVNPLFYFRQCSGLNWTDLQSDLFNPI